MKKFRAYSKNRKRFLSWNELESEIQVYSPGESGQMHAWLSCNDDIIIVWSTGLLDKNGTESCGHDIARITFDEFYSNPQFCIEEGESVVGVVKEIDFAWAVELPGKSYVYFSEIVNGEMDFEVIGNIYENPELLDA